MNERTLDFSEGNGLFSYVITWMLTHEYVPCEYITLEQICFYEGVHITHISLTSFLWDIGKQNRPRSDAAKRGV